MRENEGLPTFTDAYEKTKINNKSKASDLYKTYIAILEARDNSP